MIKPIYILIAFVGVLLFSRYVLKLGYIKCFDIIKQHINTFKTERGKWLVLPIFIYCVFPLIISGALVTIRKIDKDAINVITVIISILTSMLFTLLTITISMKGSIKDNKTKSSAEIKLFNTLLLETYYAIMFEIFVCIIVLFMCFINLFSALSSCVESFIMYYLIFTMVINLMIVLKRIFKISEQSLS